MSIGNYYSMNNQMYFKNPGFKNTQQAEGETPALAKPLEKVETAINNTVDSFVKTSENEEKKQSNRTAIAVGSSVLVLSGLVALLNPKFSGKFINRLKNWSTKTGAKVDKNKNDFLKSKFYAGVSKTLKNVVDAFQFTNSMNAAKDVGFKWLCTAEKFGGVKDKTTRSVLQTCDKGFRKVMSKVHNSITNWFDSVSKHTVQGKYKQARKKMDSLDDLIRSYRNKLTPEERMKVDAKLQEIISAREYFSASQTGARLKNQEKIMSNLEHDFTAKLKDFAGNFQGPKSHGTFKEKLKHNVDNIKDNMSYWAEDMLMPERNKLEQEGQVVVNSIMGGAKAQKGKYEEILEILAPHLSADEKHVLESSLHKAGKKLRKANHSESVEYFDKKRDLMLGGAPTDILTGLGMVGLSGIAVGTAHSKEDRISRALTLGFPAVAGIGASLTLTAMLFSGVQGMIYGSLAGVALSKIGSVADKYLTPKKPDIQLAQTTEVIANA